MGLNSGTDAIELALRAAGIPQGSEVVIPANTFVATAEAVVRAGARPVLVDVDPEYLLIDTDAVAKAIGPETSAIMPVHLFGQLAPMESLLRLASEHQIAIIEDAAQSHGATQDGKQAGAYGVAAAVSFYPGKNLGAYGDAGAVLTNSEALARSVRLLGDHGSEKKYIHEQLGFNCRLEHFRRLCCGPSWKLDAWNERRRQAADLYAELLGEIDEVVLPKTARETCTPGTCTSFRCQIVTRSCRGCTSEAFTPGSTTRCRSISSQHSVSTATARETSR